MTTGLDGHWHIWGWDEDGNAVCVQCNAPQPPVDLDQVRDHVGEEDDE